MAEKNWKEHLTIEAETPTGPIRSIEPVFSNVAVHIGEMPTIMRSLDPTKLQECYKKTLGGISLDIKQTLTSAAISGQSNEVSMADILEGVATSKLTLYFRGGHIPVKKAGENQLVSIALLAISGETLQVAVDGPQAVAEEALERATVGLFESSGLALNWTGIRNRVFAVTWKVGVLVDFGHTLMDLLHPRVASALASSFGKGEPDSTCPVLSQYFSTQFVDSYGAEPLPRKKEATVDATITIQASLFDKTCGDRSGVAISFDHEGTHMRGSTLLKVVADTDYPTLEKVLTRIAEGLNAAGSKQRNPDN